MFYRNRFFILFIFSLLSGLIFAPLYLIPFLPISLYYFIKYTQGSTIRHKLYYSAVYGFGHALGAFHWISCALLIEYHLYWWLFPISIIFFGIALGAFLAIPLFVYSIVNDRISDLINDKNAKLLQAFILSILIVSFEYIRSNIFTGFQWNLFAHAALVDVYSAQIAHYITVYGLSFLVIFLSTLSAIYFKHKEFLKISLLMAALLANSWFGHCIIAMYNTADIQSATTHIFDKFDIIQANISQREREYKKDLILHFNLSSESSKKLSMAAGVVPRFITWPEGVLGVHNTSAPEHVNYFIQYYLQHSLQDGQYLITGGINKEQTHANADAEQKFNYYNSFFVLNKMGEVVYVYNKIHLVPFGEYMPGWVRVLFPFIKPITEQFVDFNFGSVEQKNFELDGLKIMPLVCYEVIFTADIRKRIMYNGDFDVFVNIINDAWYEHSIGVWQHLDMARMQAIVFRKPVVRATIVGVSAKINQFGRVN